MSNLLCVQIKELENEKPFLHNLSLIELVRSCLQVQSSKRPNADSAIQLLSNELHSNQLKNVMKNVSMDIR